MDAWLKWICGAILLVTVPVFGASWGFYLYGRAALPGNLAPNSHAASDTTRHQFAMVEGMGNVRMPRLNPVSIWWHLYRSTRDAQGMENGLRLADHSARIILRREKADLLGIRRHAASAAGSVVVSRNWSVGDAINTLLAESFYGRGAVGLESASRAYFGVGADRLRPEESLALVVLLRGPSSFNPVCRHARFSERYLAGAMKLGMPDPASQLRRATLRLLPETCH